MPFPSPVSKCCYQELAPPLVHIFLVPLSNYDPLSLTFHHILHNCSQRHPKKRSQPSCCPPPYRILPCNRNEFFFSPLPTFFSFSSTAPARRSSSRSNFYIYLLPLETLEQISVQFPIPQLFLSSPFSNFPPIAANVDDDDNDDGKSPSSTEQATLLRSTHRPEESETSEKVSLL